MKATTPALLLLFTSSILLSTTTNFDNDGCAKHLKEHGIPDSLIPGYIQKINAANKNKQEQASYKNNGNVAPLASCTNMDFEYGNTNGWTVTGPSNITSGNGTDPYCGFPVVCPGGNFSLKLGDINVVQNSMATQTFIVNPATPVFILKFALCILNYPHSQSEAARLKIRFKDASGTVISCINYDCFYSTQTGPVGVPNFSTSTIQAPNTMGQMFTVSYVPWQNINIDLTPFVNQTVTIEVINDWCVYNVDWAYCYIDAECAPANKVLQTDEFCGNSVTTICGPAGMQNYAWTDPNGTPINTTNQCITTNVPGNFQLVCTPFISCVSSYNYAYTLPPAHDVPVAAFTAPSVCLGKQTVLTDQSSITNGSINGWNWSLGDGNSLTTQNGNYNYTGSGPYTVKLVVESDFGCKDSLLKIVDVYDTAIVNFSANKLAGCMPLCTDFSNQTVINSGSINNWVWDFGDGNTSFQPNPNHCFANDGSYRIGLTVTSDKSCTQTFNINNYITVYPIPNADFTINPSETDNLDPTVLYTDQSSGVTKFYWHFGDGMVDSTTTNPKHIFPYLENPNEQETYTTTLYVINEFGCKDSAVKKITVKPTFTFFAPNCFTPNGDLDNDGFNGVGMGIKEYQLWIFDRWGNIVYTTGQTESPEKSIPWNGKANNGSALAQEDVYVWKAAVLDVFDGRHSYVGHVSLLR
ncbi:MAG: PKD domain-containing protein [Bacteroidetes bacterium]|nr:PKD domain-containing protein [Bacteroidota bacterium]